MVIHLFTDTQRSKHRLHVSCEYRSASPYTHVKIRSELNHVRTDIVLRLVDINSKLFAHISSLVYSMCICFSVYYDADQ